MSVAVPIRRSRVLALAITATTLLTVVPFATPAAAEGLGASSVTLSVLDVSPSTPAASQTPKALSITIRVRNNTPQDLDGIQISGERRTPIETQSELDATMARPHAADSSLDSPIKTPPITVDVPRGGTQDTLFTTTTDIPTDAGVCLCANAIYPLFFTATITVDGQTITIGTTQTYIPSFEQAGVAKQQVGWVWPLLDVPHRLNSSTVFIDDDLAQEVAPLGRLDRALTVLETMAPTVPMTVITDPELLDELEVMAAGGYHVLERPGGVATLGGGTGSAAAWLSRLRTVLSQHPDTELDLTPYGDPDIEGLNRAELPWTTGVPSDMKARVTTALGGLTPTTDVAWPLNETLSKSTLQDVVHKGVQTVILNSKTLPSVMGTSTRQNALATLTQFNQITVGVTNSSIETWATKVFSASGDGLAYLPQLVSQVALHAVTSIDSSHFVLITPPRMLDVDPAVAERAIRETATTPWSSPIALHRAAQLFAAKPTSTIRTQPSTTFPDDLAETLGSVQRTLTGLDSLFLDADRANEIGALPTAVQLAASSSLVPNTSYVDRLDAVVTGLRNGVHLVTPATRRYTLTSTNSSLPITIANTLPVPAKVDISAVAVGGVPGFSTTPIHAKIVGANRTVQIRLPTHFDRTGRIEVSVSLSTPSDLALGDPITLSVRSTALGTVGVVITAVAGFVLVVALLVRALRRLRERSRRQTRASV